jgi:hypothetical protein
MIDRRELLKLFGVGTAVLPIIGGVPQLAAEATLIDVPKLQIPTHSELSGYSNLDAYKGSVAEGQYVLTVMIEYPSGERSSFHAKSFNLNFSYGNASHGYHANEVLLGPKIITWELKGQCVETDGVLGHFARYEAHHP